MEKNKRKIWFANISEYHHRAMGLVFDLSKIFVVKMEKNVLLFFMGIVFHKRICFIVL